MKGYQLYLAQQQAKQLRALELIQAQQAGIEPRRPGWIERNFLGVKDSKPRRRWFRRGGRW